MNPTELHPDLQAHSYEHPELGFAIAHPLLHTIAWADAATINKNYLQKVDAVASALEEQRWSSYIYLHEKPYRVDAFIEVADELGNKDYWELLASVWTGSENIWQNIDSWVSLWNSTRPNRELAMTENDRDELAAYPDTFTVYRGALFDENEQGMSWTSDYDKAKWFSTRFAGEGDVPVVVERVINKSEVLAYLSGRGESEVVLDLSL